MTFFMKDLETGGKVPGCVMFSIGIIQFDPFAETADEVFSDNGFYAVINKQDSLDNFLHLDTEGRDSTMSWWGRQSEEARQVLRDAEDKKKSIPLRLAVQGTIDYVTEHCAPSKARMLGNGADFDNPIFNVAAHQVGIKTPWSYGGRCYRTLKNLDEFFGPAFKAPKAARTGTHHHALDDAKTQALHLWEFLHDMRHKLRNADAKF